MAGNMKFIGMGKLLLVFLMLAFITGCAAKAPSTDNMKAELQGFELPQKPNAEEGMVYVVRPELTGTLVRFNVFLNDQEDASEVGHTRGSQHIYFMVEPGKHTIYSKAENWASVDIDVSPGETVFIRQHANLGVLMARNSLSLLNAMEGEYFVKETRPGTMINR
jgi:hypothetical protein